MFSFFVLLSITTFRSPADISENMICVQPNHVQTKFVFMQISSSILCNFTTLLRKYFALLSGTQLLFPGTW